MKSKKSTALIKTLLIFTISMPVAWGILYPILLSLSPIWRDAIKYSVTAILTVLLMKVFWGKSLFSLKCPHYLHSLVTFGLLGLIGAAGAFVFSYEKVQAPFTLELVLGCIVLNLAIAISEEFLFRGVILNALVPAFDKQRSKSGLWKAVIIANVIFGLRHLLNLILMPQTKVGTFAQVIFTGMAGIYLCAVYLRSENLWVCITIHFLEDFASSFWGISHWNAVTNNDTPIGGALGMIALQIPYVIFACLMINDKKWRSE